MALVLIVLVLGLAVIAIILGSIAHAVWEIRYLLAEWMLQETGRQFVRLTEARRPPPLPSWLRPLADWLAYLYRP